MARWRIEAAKTHPLGFEIGNEPGLFPRHEVRRHAGYGWIRKLLDELNTDTSAATSFRYSE
jgi:hypothetical protein